MAYWIFKVNPKHYLIDDRLADPEVKTTWQVTKYRDEIKAGDTAFIWRTGSTRRNRGLCAKIKITSNPIEMTEIDNEVPYCITLDVGIKCRIMGEFVERFPLICAQDIKVIPGLQGLSMFHGFQQGTNFAVSEEEGQILEKLIDTDKR